MSIWSSVQGDDVRALANRTDATNYAGEGEPDVTIDVATATSFHGLIRLALWGDDLGDVDVLLTPAAARELHHKLGLALAMVTGD